MMRKLTSGQNRAVAWALVALAVLLVLAVIGGPLLWLHHRYDVALDRLVDDLARHQRIAATREATETKLVAVKARQLERLYLKTQSPGQAAAEIQEIARAAIEGAGARLNAMQAMPHKDDGAHRLIVINVQVNAKDSALRKIWHALENHQPALILDNVVIRQSVHSASVFRPLPGNEPEMFVQFDLGGYMKVAP